MSNPNINLSSLEAQAQFIEQANKIIQIYNKRFEKSISPVEFGGTCNGLVSSYMLSIANNTKSDFESLYSLVISNGDYLDNKYLSQDELEDDDLITCMNFLNKVKFMQSDIEQFDISQKSVPKYMAGEWIDNYAATYSNDNELESVLNHLCQTEGYYNICFNNHVVTYILKKNDDGVMEHYYYDPNFEKKDYNKFISQPVHLALAYSQQITKKDESSSNVINIQKYDLTPKGVSLNSAMANTRKLINLLGHNKLLNHDFYLMLNELNYLFDNSNKPNVEIARALDNFLLNNKRAIEGIQQKLKKTAPKEVEKFKQLISDIKKDVVSYINKHRPDNISKYREKYLFNLEEISEHDIQAFAGYHNVSDCYGKVFYAYPLIANQQSMIEKLIINRHYIDRTNSAGENALHIICKTGNLEALEVFLNLDNISALNLSPLLNANNIYNEHPLHIAAKNNEIGCLTKILEQKYLNYDISQSITEDDSVMHYAVKYKSQEALEVLLNHYCEQPYPDIEFIEALKQYAEQENSSDCTNLIEASMNKLSVAQQKSNHYNHRIKR